MSNFEKYKHMKIEGVQDELRMLVADDNKGTKKIVWHGPDKLKGDVINGAEGEKVETSCNVEYNPNYIHYTFEIFNKDNQSLDKKSFNLSEFKDNTIIKSSKELYSTSPEATAAQKSTYNYNPTVPLALEANKSSIDPEIFSNTFPINTVYYSGSKFIEIPEKVYGKTITGKSDSIRTNGDIKVNVNKLNYEFKINAPTFTEQDKIVLTGTEALNKGTEIDWYNEFYQTDITPQNESYYFYPENALINDIEKESEYPTIFTKTNPINVVYYSGCTFNTGDRFATEPTLETEKIENASLFWKNPDYKGYTHNTTPKTDISTKDKAFPFIVNYSPESIHSYDSRMTGAEYSWGQGFSCWELHGPNKESDSNGHLILTDKGTHYEGLCAQIQFGDLNNETQYMEYVEKNYESLFKYNNNSNYFDFPTYPWHFHYQTTFELPGNNTVQIYVEDRDATANKKVFGASWTYICTHPYQTFHRGYKTNIKFGTQDNMVLLKYKTEEGYRFTGCWAAKPGGIYNMYYVYPKNNQTRSEWWTNYVEVALYPTYIPDPKTIGNEKAAQLGLKLMKDLCGHAIIQNVYSNGTLTYTIKLPWEIAKKVWDFKSFAQNIKNSNNSLVDDWYDRLETNTSIFNYDYYANATNSATKARLSSPGVTIGNNYFVKTSFEKDQFNLTTPPDWYSSSTTLDNTHWFGWTETDNIDSFYKMLSYIFKPVTLYHECNPVPVDLYTNLKGTSVDKILETDYIDMSGRGFFYCEEINSSYAISDIEKLGQVFLSTIVYGNKQVEEIIHQSPENYYCKFLNNKYQIDSTKIANNTPFGDEVLIFDQELKYEDNNKIFSHAGCVHKILDSNFKFLNPNNATSYELSAGKTVCENKGFAYYGEVNTSQNKLVYKKILNSDTNYSNYKWKYIIV